MRDLVIIGGGVAGLTAAGYMGRFRRPALIIDNGLSRARWIVRSHNIPGTLDGIGGGELLSRLSARAHRYGAEIRQGNVSAISKLDTGFAVKIGSTTVISRYVLMSTGVADHLPPLPGTDEALLRSVLRGCSVCDGFEAVDRNIAVLGDGDHGEQEAFFLRTYSERVCYVHVSDSSDPKRRRRLKDRGIDLIEIRPNELIIKNNVLMLDAPSTWASTFDVFYSAFACIPRVEMAESLGALCDENRALRVNAHQQTTVDGLYAAGDVVRGLNQVVVAAAEAAIACTVIHNRLRTSAR